MGEWALISPVATAGIQRQHLLDARSTTLAFSTIFGSKCLPDPVDIDLNGTHAS
ncbi:hypothetical protein I551_3321 [Mycobacterium ulcerans str. Harvey]|uniref:Uncharacterized protein n=1 Tax=Mycobacterium ulcerans str. Harvey TaxID=1299332 RepID=A0ABP3AIL4_MYCUL|nr:hypothetical protein I551_3321 [Mycobacterium ulcerans str. Harvey]